MSVLLYGILTFCLALLVHLAVWRFCLPKKDRAFVLVNVFLWTLVLGTIILRDIPGYLDYVVLYCSLAAAYIVSYPAIEIESPSLIIARDIAGAGRSGLDKSELYRTMSDKILVSDRVEDLLNADLVRMDSGKYLMTPKGHFLAGIFIRFRRLLNLPKGG